MKQRFVVEVDDNDSQKWTSLPSTAPDPLSPVTSSDTTQPHGSSSWGSVAAGVGGVAGSVASFLPPPWNLVAAGIAAAASGVAVKMP